MTELTAERARRAIVEHTGRLAESAAAAGPDTAVPTTPAWSIRDLVQHVGQTQNWVAEIIERRITDPTTLPAELAVLPADPDRWPAWLTDSAHRVANACSDGALDAAVFNPLGTRDLGPCSGCSACSTKRSCTASTLPRPRVARPRSMPTLPPR